MPYTRTRLSWWRRNQRTILVAAAVAVVVAPPSSGVGWVGGVHAAGCLLTGCITPCNHLPMATTSSNVIEVQFREETEADRMTGDRGDYFRTDAAQDVFRARFNVAMTRLAR